MGVFAVATANFSSAHWAVSLEEMTLTAAGFSMATMAQATSRGLHEVPFSFLLQMLSIFLL